MKEFKSKGISLENMVGADPMKEKKTAGTPGKAYGTVLGRIRKEVKFYITY